MTPRASAAIVEHIDLGPFSLVLQRPADPERLIDEVRFAEEEFMPYWAEVWPSGLALGRHVAGLELEGATVVELGCGLGVPSLAAARRGAIVLATDWAAEAIDLVRANAVANAIELEAREYSWTAEGTAELGRFDLVLAADVLYEERNAQPLLRLLDRTVATGGAALVADPGRRHAPAFFDRATAAGWEPEVIAAEGIPAGAIVRLTPPEARTTT